MKQRSPSNVLNPANLLSLSRIAAAVPLAWLILHQQAWSYLVAFVLFVLVAVSDTLDGRLARRYGWVSNLGVFLDLTADKIYTTAILVAMVRVGMLDSWAAIIILVREFVVTGLRSFAAAEGMVIPAGRWGKLKMLVTIIAIGWLLLQAHVAQSGVLLALDVGGVFTWLLALAPLALWSAVLLTIISGAEYVWASRGIFVAKARN